MSVIRSAHVALVHPARLAEIASFRDAPRSRAAFSTARPSRLTWEDVQAVASKEKLALFVKSYCPVCRDLVERLEDADAPFRAVALDSYENSSELSTQLRSSTSQQHVPYVYVAGTHVPSDTFIQEMKAPGDAARKRLTDAGIAVKGYFRP